MFGFDRNEEKEKDYDEKSLGGPITTHLKDRTPKIPNGTSQPAGTPNPLLLPPWHRRQTLPPPLLHRRPLHPSPHRPYPRPSPRPIRRHLHALVRAPPAPTPRQGLPSNAPITNLAPAFLRSQPLPHHVLIAPRLTIPPLPRPQSYPSPAVSPKKTVRAHSHAKQTGTPLPVY
jgi:hypothetical protein